MIKGPQPVCIEKPILIFSFISRLNYEVARYISSMPLTPLRFELSRGTIHVTLQPTGRMCGYWRIRAGNVEMQN